MYRAWLRQTARAKAPQPLYRRNFASPQAPKHEMPPKTPHSKTRERLDRWIARSPKFFKPTLRALRDAPASYIVSFLVLHEITAIVPLVGLAYAFHYFRWLPPYFAEGKWVIEGEEKFGKYARKKGWIQEKEEKKVESKTREGRARLYEKGKVSKMWNKGEEAGRWLVEFATAYAVVKVLLPLRIMISVWGAPGFARLTVIPIRNAVRARWRKRGIK